MKPPKKIYLNPVIDGKTKFHLGYDWSKSNNGKGTAFYKEEHIKSVAKSLGMNPNAFIFQLNGGTYAEYLKSDPPSHQSVRSTTGEIIAERIDNLSQ